MGTSAAPVRGKREALRVHLFRQAGRTSCVFVLPGRAPAYIYVDLIGVEEARGTVATLRQAIRNGDSRFRLISVKGLGDEAWRQTSPSEVRGMSDNIRFIVRKGSRAFQVHTSGDRGEQGITQSKMRALAELVVRRL
jgi:hypothetical protein